MQTPDFIAVQLIFCCLQALLIPTANPDTVRFEKKLLNHLNQTIFFLLCHNGNIVQRIKISLIIFPHNHRVHKELPKTEKIYSSMGKTLLMSEVTGERSDCFRRHMWTT